MRILSIDIGGTSIKYSIIEDINNFEVMTVSTRDSNKELCLNALEQIIKENKDVDYISISCPGAIIKNSYISGMNGIKGFWDFDLVDELKSRGIDKPILVINDANAAAYAEYFSGAAKGSKTVAMLTIGTGIGGGLIINGQLVEGQRGFGAEYGYLSITEERDEAFLGSSEAGAFWALETHFKEKTGQNKTGKEIFEDYYNNDEKTYESINRFYKAIITTIWNITFTVDPDVIIIGGGLSNNDKAIDELKERVSDLLVKKKLDKDKIKGMFNIKKAEYKNKAGIIGAYAFCQERIKNG